MTTLTQTVKFDPNGQKLWLRVPSMIGLVQMNYSWVLKSNNPGEPFVLTINPNTGSNLNPQSAQILNDTFTPPPPEEPVAKMDNRFIDFTMIITGVIGDIFAFTIEIVQDTSATGTNVIGFLSSPANSNLATNSDTYQCLITLNHV